MFFILSKTVVFILLPSNFLILLSLVGVVLLTTRFRRSGVWLASIGVVLLAVAGFSPLAAVMTHELERRFPPWDAARGAPDGIVILGGAISPRMSRAYNQTAVSSDAGRILAIAKLARAYPQARLVYSGGDASLFAEEHAEADFIYPLLDDFGISRDRMILETKSRNTQENAQFTKDLVQPKAAERWLLVTSAQHMPRAIGSFRKAGFTVEAYPVAWHIGRRIALRPSDNFAATLLRLDLATREWIGLIAYWLTGRTSAFLPGPAA
jgi:uncharacterized SAM-binding protein YcdF (DUF218 family)